MPGPWRITLDTNPGLCNHNCIMCEEHSAHSGIVPNRHRIMSKEMMKSAIRLFVEDGLKEVIPSTMGEPLLYPYMDDLIAEISDNGLRLNLTTNGSFPGRSIKEWAEILVPLASDIKISINGSYKQLSESIMVGSDFNRQISGIRELVSMRDNHCDASTTITMQTTFMESNLEDLPSLIRLAGTLGVDRVKGHHLWVMNDAMVQEDLRRDQESISRWNGVIERITETIDEMKIEGTRVPSLQNFNFLTDGEHDNSGICPFLGYELWIAWDGQINVCCAPHELRRSFGDFGNVSDGMNIFETPAYKRLLSGYRHNSICMMCNMRGEE